MPKNIDSFVQGNICSACVCFPDIHKYGQMSHSPKQLVRYLLRLLLLGIIQDHQIILSAIALFVTISGFLLQATC